MSRPQQWFVAPGSNVGGDEGHEYGPFASFDLAEQFVLDHGIDRPQFIERLDAETWEWLTNRLASTD